MEGHFSPQRAEDSSPLEYDTDSSSSFEHEAVRKGRGVRLQYQIRGKICHSAKDSMGSDLLEKHISNLSHDQSIACESVVEQVRGSAAWNSFVEKLTPDSSQAAPHFLGKTSNVLSDSPGAYNKLGSGKSIEKHLQNYFIELIKSFTALPDIKHALSKSRYARCMISSGAIPMGTPHISETSVDQGKIRPDICIVAFNEQDNKGPNLIRYQRACPGVLSAEYLNGNGRSSRAKQPEISINGIEAELAVSAKTAPTTFWENVLGVCSVKANCGETAMAENISDCALWASEILRHQWNRQFLNVCFLCGTMLQFLRFDRSGCSVSEGIDIREHTTAFLKLMLSYFVFDYSRLGLNAHVGRSLQRHRVVRVNAKKFELGKQITYPSRDSLICRGTSTFMAREMIENEEGSDYVDTQAPWDLCYKISWINSARPHEGAFLTKLKDVRNVVECHGYDTGVSTIQGRDQCIFGDYTIKKPGIPSPGEQLSPRVS